MHVSWVEFVCRAAWYRWWPWGVGAVAGTGSLVGGLGCGEDEALEGLEALLDLAEGHLDGAQAVVQAV